MNSSPYWKVSNRRQLNKKRLLNSIYRAAERSFIDWNDYYKHADEVILFGSWAFGVERPTSDIDVLCIGQGKSVTSNVLHILCMSRSRFRQHVLRGSELASHVAAYGIWLKGNRSVPKYIGPSHATVDRRRRLLDSRVRALCAHWRDLRGEFKRKHADKVRRDLQRLSLLKMGRPNVPAPGTRQRMAKNAAPLKARIRLAP